MELETPAQRIERHLKTIYPKYACDVVPQIRQRTEQYACQLSEREVPEHLWTERDVVLITYGDQVSEEGQPSLATLQTFLTEFRLQKALPIVHLLPFCPYSSDDGFSVIDFRRIDERLGDWDQVRELGQQFDLMFDLVLNHVSQHSDWFQSYTNGDQKYANWFHAVDPHEDLSLVTRPRSHPLLTAFKTANGERHIWTTFSEDQIDLNYSEPAVLLEMLDILLSYVANGARIIRLDAIAFLWKEIGTTCLHLTQTHAVVKLFRAVLDEVTPDVVLLTETNVPHTENVSYFGDGDEARMVYQFSLPPLLFDAYVNEEASPLRNWLADLETPAKGTTWFNFTASHDGIGVRPLEGIVDGDRFERLIDATRDRGGQVSMRQMPNGDQRPYELNITWSDAMRIPGESDPLHIRRVLASQAFMLALKGVPAVYFHTLVGTPNDVAGVEQSSHARRINRRKFGFAELVDLLTSDPEQSMIFDGYRRLLTIRNIQPAFHPDATQRVLKTSDPAVVAFVRECPKIGQRILIAANFSNTSREFSIASFGHEPKWRDLIENSSFSGESIVLAACQIVWLVPEKD
ncbi:MAG: alpha-amylase family glycosyl hydrolase [Planctomycetota bacterium]|jgi:sucrose phosphorylase